jgi:hypothetical protein
MLNEMTIDQDYLYWHGLEAMKTSNNVDEKRKIAVDNKYD